MKYTDQKIRKMAYRFLIEKNEYKSPEPEMEPRYLSQAANCQFSIIEDKYSQDAVRYIATFIWEPESVFYYDVLSLCENALLTITREGCCEKHCDTWRDYEVTELVGELLPISRWKKDKDK